jgi:hypothetical protein
MDRPTMTAADETPKIIRSAKRRHAPISVCILRLHDCEKSPGEILGAEVVQKTGRTDLRVLVPPVSARRFQKVGGYRATDEIVVPKHAIMAGLGFFVCWHDGAAPDAGVVEAVHQHALAGLEYGGGTHFDGATQTHMPKR